MEPKLGLEPRTPHYECGVLPLNYSGEKGACSRTRTCNDQVCYLGKNSPPTGVYLKNTSGSEKRAQAGIEPAFFHGFAVELYTRENGACEQD